KFAWSDATKTTAHAISSGRPNRWSGTTLLDDRVRCRQNPCDLDLLAIDHGRDLRRDLLLPVVALVDEIVEALALGLALEAADPDVHAFVFLADEAAEDHHPHLDLERDDLLFHALHPLVALARMDVVLPELEEHVGLPGLSARRGRRPGAQRVLYDSLAVKVSR